MFAPPFRSRAFVGITKLAAMALAFFLVEIACGDSVSGPVKPSSDASELDAESDAKVEPMVDAAGGLQAAAEPPSPTFPAIVGTVSVGIRTDAASTAGTDDPFELCFSETPTSPPAYCRKLDLQGVNDFRVGGFDRHHFEGLNMPRTAAKYAVVRPVATAANAVRLACLDVRFDGEPVSCRDNLQQFVGSGAGAGEVDDFRMPLANSCDTCEPEKLVHGPKWAPMEAGRARMWIRTDATRKVGLLVSPNPDGKDAVPVAWAYPKPSNDFAETLLSTVLPDARSYYYGVTVDGSLAVPFQPMPRPPAPLSRVRLGMGSCARELPQPIYAGLAKTNLDLFLFLGDNHYGNSAELDVHRYEYRRLDGIADRALFLRRVPVLATWDDHDYVENNSDGLCAGRATALRGFSEAWPTISTGTTTTPGTFSKASFGPVDIVMLDCRSYRPRVNDPGRNCDVGAPVPDGQDTAAGPLGAAQYTWMMDQLASSRAPFKLVACGSLFTSNGVDSWASFPAARTRFFSELGTKGIQGVVLASGDIHRSEFRKYSRGPSLYPMFELVSSPLARLTANSCTGEPDPVRVGECYAGGNSFISLEVDGTLADPTLVARIHREDGNAVQELTLKRSELQ